MVDRDIAQLFELMGPFLSSRMEMAAVAVLTFKAVASSFTSLTKEQVGN